MKFTYIKNDAISPKSVTTKTEYIDKDVSMLDSAQEIFVVINY